MAVAHVLISCDSGFENQIILELKKFDFVHEARVVYGLFDIVVKLESPNMQELRENISDDIRNIKNINTTMTLMNVDN